MLRIASAALMLSLMSLYGFDMIEPMNNAVIVSPPGLRVNPIGGADYQLHKGSDIVGPPSAPVMAVAYGRVIGFWLDHLQYGGLVLIQHDDGIITLYAHMSKVFVKLHQIVEQGDIIGLQGNTGVSTGEHLHFEIITDPAYVFARSNDENKKEQKSKEAAAYFPH